MIRYRLYTGPAFVNQIAARLEATGHANVLAGTEHVHFDSMADQWTTYRTLRTVLGFVDLAHLTVLRRIPEQVTPCE